MNTHGNESAATTSDWIAREQRVSASNYLPVPVVIDSARDVRLRDVDGREYLDFMSGYSAVSHGHLHPRLVAALQAQLGKLAVTSRAFHTTELARFLEKVCEVTGFERALPMNSGAEAVETGIKAARRWGCRVRGIADGRAEILVARNNFHGRTTTIVGFSSDESYRAGFGPFAPGFRAFDFGDMASVEAARTADTCAVLVEPIQGEAGIVVPPEGWLRALRDWCTRHGILLILDEIQSGLGRTGRMFACEHEGVRPDAMVLGKALGGGLLPVSVFVADRTVMDVFDPGSHGSTFGGNALAAAVGLAALEVIEEENLVARSAALGRHLLERLQSIRSPLIREVRGRGLWVAIDIDPARASARAVVERLAERGVLSKETHQTVIRCAPPLTISRADLDWAIDRVAETLAEFAPVAVPGVERPAGSEPTVGAAGVEPRDAAGSARPTLAMSPPDHFEVSYRINPWMDPKLWSLDAERLRHEARAEWTALRATFESLGVEVETMPAAAGLPDLVFTANSAMVLDGKVLLARFRSAERQGEEACGERFFESLRRRARVREVHRMPDGVCFEGAGDAIWDASRGIVWMGYGQRSDFAARRTVEQVFGVPTLALELVDPRFYHLDTCLCVLSGGEVLYYPPAFSERGRAEMKKVVGPALVACGDDDALALGINSVCVGRDVVMASCSEATRQVLARRGYRVHVVPLGAFARSGGAAYCLTLRLDLATRDAASTSGEPRAA